MSVRRRVFTLNDPHAMRINQELAMEIGFQESIVLLQIEHLVSITEFEFDGEPWTRATLDELRERQFPWWSNATISRILHRLESQSLIKIANYNRAGYDRTQWFTVDISGVEELDSVAIFHSETARSRDISECKMDTDRMKYPSEQNETTIPETYSRDLKESPSNEGPKKAESPPAPGSSSPRRVKALSDSEAEERFAELCERSKHGESLRALAELLAEDNQTGKVAMTRVWREIGQRYLANRKRYGEVSEKAWAYGFEAALAKGAGNVGYVTAAARGYRPDTKKQGKSRDSIAVIGATEDDYREEDYRFHA